MGQGQSTSSLFNIHVSVAGIQGARPEMEDAHRVKALPHFSSILMAAIFDGHGGDAAANYCSKYLSDAVDHALSDSLGSNSAVLKDALEQAIIAGCLKTDDGFLQTAKQDKSGCVAAMVFVDQNTGTLCAATVGDAQSIICTRGVASRMSVIHKPFFPAEQQRIEAAGHYVLNGRLDGALAISRAFGDHQFKVSKQQVDGKEETILTQPATSRACIAVPATALRQMEPGDEFIIIGCDGLWDVMNHEEAAAWVRRRFEIEKKDCGFSPAWCKQPFKMLAKELCEYALTKGSTDNVSVIILLIEWKDKVDAATKSEKATTAKPSET
jgi:serine/threonine protein phosphatase PrpC